MSLYRERQNRGITGFRDGPDVGSPPGLENDLRFGLITGTNFFISPLVDGEVAEWSKALPC
jgi:hypothetical protein